MRTKSLAAMLVALAVLAGLSAACDILTPPPTPTPIPTPTSPPLADELILYDWAEDMPQSVLDAFTQEYGVQVTYLTFESTDEVDENLRAGQVYDVVVLENDAIPLLVADGLLAEIDYRHVPNFKNISANFRDLAYDPGNKHSIPFNWGTTGLVARSDLVKTPLARWADLWQLPTDAKIALRDEPREQLGMALKALGYSINSEDPQELEAALGHLLKIRQHVVIVDPYAEAVIPMLADGQVAVLVGWAEDALLGREENEAIVYVLPEEGTLLWGDNFAIPANSPHRYTAEVFLNFVLRPEISAQIVNENYYPMANEAARPFIDPEILNDPLIFPPSESLKNAEVYLPLSPEGEELYKQLWARFKAAEQP